MISLWSTYSCGGEKLLKTDRFLIEQQGVCQDAVLEGEAGLVYNRSSVQFLKGG